MISSELHGFRVELTEAHVDERWTMAFAAGLGDLNRVYFDTTDPRGLVAHPLFPVCFEWPVIVASRLVATEPGASTVGGAAVHASHDLVVHRLLRPDETVRTELEIIGVERTRPGVLLTMAQRTLDGEGELVATTTYTTLHLGHDIDGPEHTPPISADAPPPAPTDLDFETTHQVSLAAEAAHVYTECARIWNPIHTSLAVATAGGLPDIILHGTATMAHAVSTVVSHYCADDPSLVRRIGGRFRGMVLLPSTITIRTTAPRVDGQGYVVWFEVQSEDRAAVIDRGYVVID